MTFTLAKMSSPCLLLLLLSLIYTLRLKLISTLCSLAWLKEKKNKTCLIDSLSIFGFQWQFLKICAIHGNI